jgi:hypothetical protein
MFRFTVKIIFHIDSETAVVDRDDKDRNELLWLVLFDWCMINF